MAVREQLITKDFALYNSDCVEVMQSLPSESIHLSVYSPPFGGLYHYSSDERDLSNCNDLQSFMDHYRFVVRELFRLTMPGRISCVHCSDIPAGNSGGDHLIDLPGKIIDLHEQEGFRLFARHSIWKEPLEVRNRTLRKDLAHKTIVDDSTEASVAGADYLLVFRRKGENKVPVAHPNGLMEYAGSRMPPSEVLKYRGWTGKQTENRFSHWIWRQYASSFWDDVRMERVLPYREARDSEDEKHVHPLQLDVIDRCVTLRSNPGEVVLTPFMGVGSEVYIPVLMGRRAIGIELKPSYYRQAVKNVQAAADGRKFDAQTDDLFDAEQ